MIGVTGNKNVRKPYLLDAFPSASAAYSLRKVNRDYSGSAVRVRRSSDNTEQDIGFLQNGDLDTGSMTSFVGANSGFVTRWYDQSGNNNHLVQSTATQQPRLVNAGTIETVGGKPCLYFYNSSAPYQNMNFTTPVSGSGPFTSFYPTKIDNTTNGISPWFTSNTNATTPYTPVELQTAGYYIAKAGTTLYSGGTTNTNYKLLTGLMPSVGVPTIFSNGTSVGALTSGTDGNGTMFHGLGLRTDVPTRLSRTPEMILYLSDLSSSRAAIESNINSYYNIY